MSKNGDRWDRSSEGVGEMKSGRDLSGTCEIMGSRWWHLQLCEEKTT